ncbi:hypothetical protein D3C75_1261600 [compost metagenome]
MKITRLVRGDSNLVSVMTPPRVEKIMVASVSCPVQPNSPCPLGLFLTGSHQGGRQNETHAVVGRPALRRERHRLSLPHGHEED